MHNDLFISKQENVIISSKSEILQNILPNLARENFAKFMYRLLHGKMSYRHCNRPFAPTKKFEGSSDCRI